jgi:hypothetical protein
MNRRADALAFLDGGNMNDDDSQQFEAKDAPDALDLLADRDKPIWHLFEQFDRLKDSRNDKTKMDLVTTICREISASTQSAAEDAPAVRSVTRHL